MGTPGIAVGAATQAKKQSSQAPIIGDRVEILKGLLLARARRASISVFETGGGGFAINYLAYNREVPDLRTLQSCLTQMGVPA